MDDVSARSGARGGPHRAGAESAARSRSAGPAPARSAPELTALLLELGRAVKARRYYPVGERPWIRVFGRAQRSWQADLARHGALDLAIDAEGFRALPGAERVAPPQLGELCEQLRLHGVVRLRLAETIDAEAFAGLVEVLAARAPALAAEGGLAAALAARVPAGIEVEIDGAAAPTASPADPAAPAAPPDDDEDTQEVVLVRRAGAPDPYADTAPRLDLEGGGDAPEGDAPEASADEWKPADAPAEAAPERPAAAALGTADRDPTDAAGAAPGTPAPRAGDPEPARDLPPAMPELPFLLEEIDACDDAARYADLARRCSQLASRAVQTGRGDDAHAVVLTLSRHVDEGKKRGERLHELAWEFLMPLASGPLLDELIERACGPDAESVESTRVLLQLGEEVAPTLMHGALLEPDPDRRGRLQGILIALGPKALPAVLEAMAAADPDLAAMAVRLAGDVQDPRAVPALEQLVEHAEEPIRAEAARSLARIGETSAVAALGRALEGARGRDAELLIHCLAATRSTNAVAPLAGAVERAWRQGRGELGREAVRALARLGCAEAATPLAELLVQRSLRHRRTLRELKTAAAAALGALPGDEAVGALAQAAGAKDAALRRAARSALERRANARGARSLI